MTPAPQIGQEHQSWGPRGSYTAHSLCLLSLSHKRKIHTPQTLSQEITVPILTTQLHLGPRDGCTMINPWCWRNDKAPQLCEAPLGWQQSSHISSKPFSRDTHTGSVSAGTSVILNPWPLPGLLNQIVLDYAAKRSRFITMKKWHLGKDMGWFDMFL